MVFLQKCCCGCSLKAGSLIIVYVVLAENIFTFLNLLLHAQDHSVSDKPIASPRADSSNIKFFTFWTPIFNIIVDFTALYGIYKKKAPLLIPFLAYRTVNLIFMSFTLMNSRNIADYVAGEVEKKMYRNETLINENEVPDLFPIILIGVLIAMGVEFYCLLAVYSYYQTLLQSGRIVASLPVVTYSVQPQEQLNMYNQPPINPYVGLYAPKYPYQLENSKYAYNPNLIGTAPSDLPPPYCT